MAIYHFDLSAVRKAGGTLGRAAHHGGLRLSHGATGKVAYISGEKLTDDRGVVTDYRTKSHGVDHSETFLPDGVTRVNREDLWRAIDAHPTRSPKAIVGRDAIVALPHELNRSQRIEAARAFCIWAANRYGVAVELGVHSPEIRKGSSEKNHHFHAMISDRQINQDGSLGKLCRDLNALACLPDPTRGREAKPKPVFEMREAWERIANEALERAGSTERVDRRTLKEQGIERAPGQHLGAERTNRARDLARTAWKRRVPELLERRPHSPRTVRLDLQRIAQRLRERERLAEARIAAVNEARKISIDACVGANLGHLNAWAENTAETFFHVMANLSRAEQLRRQLAEIERVRAPMRGPTEAEAEVLRSAGRSRSRSRSMRERVERLSDALAGLHDRLELQSRPGGKARVDEIEQLLRSREGFGLGRERAA